MKNLILNGCNGHMGRVITRCVNERSDCSIIAGFDINDKSYDVYPVYTSPDEFEGKADAIIDFSHPSALYPLLNYAVKNNIPAVISTTGLNEEMIHAVHQASKDIPVFFSANMSIGVNLLCELAKSAAAVLGKSFDIEIIEQHHNQKIDAPSGTALMLADSISSVLEEPARYMYDRHSQRKKREKNEIGIHSVRGGTIVGDHEIIFAGRDEVISLRHTAQSKDIFAEGSINAALFLCDKEPGLYNMKDLVLAAQK